MAKHSGLATRAECIVAMSTEETDTDNTAATLPTRQPPTARTITITVTVNVTVTVDVVACQSLSRRHVLRNAPDNNEGCGIERASPGGILR